MIELLKRFFTKPVLGLEEPIVITDKKGKKHHLLAKLDTGAYRTSIDQTVAKQLGIDTPVIETRGYRSSLGRETRSIIAATITIQHVTITTEVSLTDRSHLHYKIILGRRDLQDFLIDPAKTGELLSKH